MTTSRSPLRQDTLFYPASTLLELPTVLMFAGHTDARQDTLNASVPFSVSPFHFPGGVNLGPTSATGLDPEGPSSENLPPEEPDPAEQNQNLERRLKTLRKSPGFKLVADSLLLLRTCQLDMDCPPGREHYVREQLKALLMQLTGKPLDPDQLHITFTTEEHPSVDAAGRERYSDRLSLTEIALSSFDAPRFMGLYRSKIEEQALSDQTTLTATAVFRQIANAPWTQQYGTALETFWAQHATTYRALYRLGFLDALAHQSLRGRISKAGYDLTLDALGLRTFPTHAAALEQTGRGTKTQVRMLSINGETVPGIFQVSSKNTSHCFIHLSGNRGEVIEYISDKPEDMCTRLVAAMNASGLHGRVLHEFAPDENDRIVLDTPLIDTDVFIELTRAQESFTHRLSGAEQHDDSDLLRPIARGLALASAVDLWQTHLAILDDVPVAPAIANRVMTNYLKDHHRLTLDPDHVFIAYRHGDNITQLGDARRPSTYVHSPDETPVSLSQALIRNYRVDRPVGYIDHDGGTDVFLDTTGKGVLADDQILDIAPQALEDYIKAFDFLTLMTRRINDFWERRKQSIEQAFTSAFITQALISLKLGSLGREGFDRVVHALSYPEAAVWHVLSFYIQGSLVDGLEHQPTGLLVLEEPGRLKILYQAGHPKAFVEFRNDQEFNAYLNRVTADQDWRDTVMQYVPGHYHERLNYLFKLWGSVAAPSPPASILRPWTDALYNPDTRKAMHHSLCEEKLPGSPFAFLRQLLKQNAQADAQQQIVTPAQVSLDHWTTRLRHLQRLLGPMSLVLTPAFMASLATEIGIASLNIASANLPGKRHEEKHQALLSLLSLGLLQAGPRTPGLARALGKAMRSARTRAGSASVAQSNVTETLLSRSMAARQTRLETFFYTDARLKRWTVLDTGEFAQVAIHAWKLGRRFLLWTSDRGQARTLVVSTHGYYLPWTSTVKIPNGSEIRTYAPHGYELVDPALHRVVSKSVSPFSVATTVDNTPVRPLPSWAPLVLTDKVMAGTALTGRLKNYTLSKFQSPTYESYEDIARIVRNSHLSPLRSQLPRTPMDVLTVRNRFGMLSPTLDDLFSTLAGNGIHYDRILLVHCRCAAIDVLLRRSQIYVAPTVKPMIVKMSDPIKQPP